VKLVAAAIIIAKGKVLLARRKRGDSHQGYWEFPGGAVEPGETLEECLARELGEELGVEATIGEVVARSECRSVSGALDLVALRAYIGEGEFTLTAHDRVAWVSPRDVGRYRLAPADVPIARALREKAGLFQE
jgi:8-oxo-dGTP diphosphatase